MTIQSDKIMFLNLQGSLNSIDNSKAMGIVHNYVTHTVDHEDSFGKLFDNRCVLWLKYIIHQTNCDIVIMGSWALKGLEELKKMWEERALPGKVIDICHPLSNPWAWMETKDYKGKFCIVNPDYQESIVVVKPFKDIGLQIADVHKIITKLNN